VKKGGGPRRGVVRRKKITVGREKQDKSEKKGEEDFLEEKVYRHDLSWVALGEKGVIK